MSASERRRCETSRGLPESLAAIGEELSQGQATEFRVGVGGSARPLAPALRDEAYGIGREALINAFQHAQARSIEVQWSADLLARRHA